MRRSSWLVVLGVSLAACGLDVVGTDPSSVTPLADGGGASSSSGGRDGGSSSSSGGSTEGDAAPDGPYVPPFDAGAAEIVLDGVEGLTSITIAGKRLVAGRADLEAVTIDLSNQKKGTIPNIKKARALLADADDVFFVAQLDDVSGNVGHWKADGTDNGVTHSNEPPGRDLSLEGTLLFGSYKDHVVSYTAADMDNVQDRSDKDGTPMGVVASATDVYWADDLRGAVFKDSRTVVGPQTKVIDALDHPSALTLVGLVLYVATSTTITQVLPTVQTIASGLSKPTALTHDGAVLYWIDASGGFLKRQTPGTPVETIGTLPPFAEWRPKLIDFKDGYVYWGSPNEGRVYRRKE